MNLGFANILILLLFSPKTNEQRRMAIGGQKRIDPVRRRGPADRHTVGLMSMPKNLICSI